MISSKNYVKCFFYYDATPPSSQLHNYDLKLVKISKFLERLSDREISNLSDFERKKELIMCGDKLRKQHGNNYLARIALGQICSQRNSEEKSERTAYLIDGFKHYDEIDLFRSIYGGAFFLIGLYGDDLKRHKSLTKKKGLSVGEADELMKLEQDDKDDHGQKVEKSFYRSDVFIPTDCEVRGKKELSRFIDLVFGHPYHTPNKDEYAMFHAYAASLRSADLSRQVGSVITTSEGDIISQGANDVPKFGGGQYWSDDVGLNGDQRDHILKYDSNKIQMNKVFDNLSKKITSDNAYKKISDTYKKLKDTENNLIDVIMNKVRDSELKDITEYGRAVHAEMAALLSASRLGIRLSGASLFSTTYPCHNCAKHIVAAGISRVVYIEPYSKSLAHKLHDDSITKNKSEKENKLFFEPFVGVGPRRFFDLFSLTLSSGREIKRHSKGFKIDFESGKAKVKPRVQLRTESIQCVEHQQKIYEDDKLS